MKELGESLKGKRMRQGLSLQSVAERTRISIDILQTLETGDYERIGTPILIRSFVRAYCSALDIDPEPLLENYREEILAFDQQGQGIQRYQRLSASFYQKRRSRVFVWLLLGFALVGTLVAGVWVANKKSRLSLPQSLTKDIIPQLELPSDLSRRGAVPPPAKLNGDALEGSDEYAPSASGMLTETRTDHEVSLPSSSSQEKPEIFKPLPSESDTPAATITEKPLTTAPNGRHRLSVEATEKVWIQVRTDNKDISDALLQPGDKREWEAGETMDIVLGNAGGIRMLWDGQPLKPAGKSGEVVRLHLPDAKFLEEGSTR